ncbi:MAG: FkbM family methyltransferase [Candidatus Andersenbacteria bacterium]
MQELIKKILPANLINGILAITTRLAVRYYYWRYPPLIIRPGTTDLGVFQSIFVLRELKLPTPTSPKLIIDAGAYTGFSTLYYATIFPQATVIAVEPEASNYAVLVQNTRLLPNVRTTQAGLWPVDAYLQIIDRETGKWGFSVREVEEADEYDVKAVTMDTILKYSESTIIDILKLDIEGAEKELFSRNYQLWINKVNTIVIELHDRINPGCTQALMAAVDPKLWNHSTAGEKVILVRKHPITQ